MDKEIDFSKKSMYPAFEEGCRIWIEGIMPYLEVREDKSVWFCPPEVEDPVPGTDITPVRVIEGVPEHNFFCQKGCYKRLNYDGRALRCRRCGYLNSLRGFLKERINIIEDSKINNAEKTNDIMKSRRIENGVETHWMNYGEEVWRKTE